MAAVETGTDWWASNQPKITAPAPSAVAPPQQNASAPPPVDGSAESISAYFKSRGVPDTETPYWVGKWQELQQRGQEIGDPNYAMMRLSKADIFGGQGGQQGTGDWQSGQGVTPTELSSYGVPSSPYASSPFGSSYTSPAIPGYLASPYTLPTQAELEATPGYGSRLAAGQRTMENSAAAKGSILNGGTQKALARYGQDYASNEYSNLVGQSLGARQQNQGEYQANVVAPAQVAYQNQYRQYLDDQQRQLNDYLTNYNINRTGVQDFLGQQNKTADRGLQATYYGRPS